MCKLFVTSTELQRKW